MSENGTTCRDLRLRAELEEKRANRMAEENERLRDENHKLWLHIRAAGLDVRLVQSADAPPNQRERAYMERLREVVA